MKTHHRTRFALVALLVLVFGFAFSSPGASASDTVSIGNSPAHEGQLVGPKSRADRLHLDIALNLRDEAGLNQLIADQSNPASRFYKKYITPKEFGARFGATTAQEASVVRYLRNAGIRVTSRNPEHTFIGAEATVQQAQSLFNISINTYRDARGRTFYANDRPAQIPASLATTVKAILGLDNFEVWHPTSKFDTVQPNTGPAGGYTPTELRGAYDAAPLNSAGYTGTGQKVALFELDGFKQSNITTYVNNYSLGSPTPTTVLVDGYNGSANQAGGEAEVELDIEVVDAIAPKTNIAVYEGPNSNTGVLDTYQKIATSNTEKVISTSWGLCEASSGTSTLSSLDTVFKQMSTQGQSIFAASGDSGAYDCGTSSLAVDNPADDPYVTGVGGTNLQISGTSYGNESVWSNSSNSSGGGGGVSTYFAHPSWQTGTGTNTGIKRQVPDVSADADPASGYSVYTSYCDQNGANCATKWTVFGGTSAAAPLWAGITALNNQYAAANGKGNLGYANPTLYGLFNGTQTYPAFHDITSGNNLYYSATTGYDMASGIGTPDAYNLVRDLAGSTGGGGGGGGGGTPQQLITNGGFESGSSPWTESSSGGYELVDTSLPHTGSYSAYLCGYNSCTDAIYQTISVPSNVTTVTLTYYTYISTQESGSTAYDYFRAQVRNTSNTVLKTLQTLSNASTKGAWVKSTYDLSTYKGQTIRVYFYGTNDSSLPTDFFLDDVSVTAQ